MDYIIAFLISVLAGIVGHFICKWLDRDKQQQLAQVIPPYKGKEPQKVASFWGSSLSHGQNSFPSYYYIITILGKCQQPLFYISSLSQPPSISYIFKKSYSVSVILEFPSFRGFLNANRNRHRHTNHWVIAGTDKTHHLYVCRHGRGTCELSI